MADSKLQDAPIDSHKVVNSALPSGPDTLPSTDSDGVLVGLMNTPETGFSEDVTARFDTGRSEKLEASATSEIAGETQDFIPHTEVLGDHQSTRAEPSTESDFLGEKNEQNDIPSTLDGADVSLTPGDTVSSAPLDATRDNMSEYTDVTLGSVLDQPNTQSTPQNSGMPQLSEEEANPILAQFMKACQDGDLAVVTDLISSGMVHTEDTFSEGITGLHWAAINNRITVVKYLTENPYSPADPNKLGGTLSASPLHWACRNGLVYVVDYLLSHTSADPTLKDLQQYNALHLAVHSSNITLVVYILLKCVLIDKSIYIDEADNIQCTALHWAAYQGDILTVKALLHYGADVSKVDKSLMTPLHWGFIRGYKSVLAALLEAGSDIFHKNDKSRDSFGVAADMDCEATWIQVLKEADRDARRNWEPNTHLLSAKTAKLITFFTPYVTLPIALHACSFSAGYAIPKLFFSVLVFAASIFFLLKFIIPTYLRKNKALFQTPYLAGLFSASANWTVVTWIFVVLPKVWLDRFFTNVALAGLVVSMTYAFFKAMTINPGNVPVPTDPKIVFDDVKRLVALGKFDTEHFCVNTFTRKPLRSKFSRTSNALVARFDHYCPWVYNDIGVRNHKLFITFVYSLSAAIILFSSLALKYFEEYSEDMGYSTDTEDICWLLSEDLCLGFTHRHFVFNLTIWCWMQGIWIVFLCVVQTFQICKGLTTWEFSSLDKKMSSSAYNHSTVPGDFHGPNGMPLAQPMSHDHHHNNGLATCFKLLGLDQFCKTLKVGLMLLLKNTTHNDTYSSIESFDIPTDYGWKQNWLDFWFIGDIEWRNIFYLPIDGENNLNGQVVDYYKLYEYPPKLSGAAAV